MPWQEQFDAREAIRFEAEEKARAEYRAMIAAKNNKNRKESIMTTNLKMDFAVTLGGLTYEVEDNYLIKIVDCERVGKYELTDKLVSELLKIKGLHDHNDANRVYKTQLVLEEFEDIYEELHEDREKVINSVVEGMLSEREYVEENVNTGVTAILNYAHDGMNISITNEEAEEILSRLKDHLSN